MATVALTTAAPEGSVTVPVIDDEFPDCAKVATETAEQHSAKMAINHTLCVANDSARIIRPLLMRVRAEAAVYGGAGGTPGSKERVKGVREFFRNELDATAEGRVEKRRASRSQRTVRTNQH